MENCLIIDGVKLNIPQEEIDKLKEKYSPKKSIFDRLKDGESYYYVDEDGDVIDDTEGGFVIDYAKYNIVNYCTDKEYLQNRTDREVLNRKLEKFSLENGGSEIDWNDSSQSKYYIYIDVSGELTIEYMQYGRSIGETYFISYETCQQAIIKFENEIRKVYNLPPF